MNQRRSLSSRACFAAAGALLCGLASALAQEKERADLPEPAAVTVDGIRYAAPPFTRAQGLPHNGGYVEAIDARTGKRRWIVDVIGAPRDKGMEGDKQDVFITELALDANRQHLLVTDERGRRWRIELRSLHVERLSALP